MMDPNYADGSSFPNFTFVLPGRPLLLASDSKALNRARNQLQELVNARKAGDYFPIPSNIPIEFDVTFHYPSNINAPIILDLTTISREITIGIIYVDNNSIFNKSVGRGAVATTDSDNPEGSTIFRIRPMV